ncbi:hypothetical protein L218DRAFT_1009292 [Marasmius fiardii PR-910]|nr:hypothetical protein L218DRAFT_1009292 [Marasmius fiardii PR-910]
MSSASATPTQKHQLPNSPSVGTLFRRAVVNPFIISAVTLFLYGLYIFLFRIGFDILRKRKKSWERLFHQVSLASLFILASIGVPLGIGYDILVVAISFWDLAGSGFPVVLYRVQLGFE